MNVINSKLSASQYIELHELIEKELGIKKEVDLLGKLKCEVEKLNSEFNRFDVKSFSFHNDVVYCDAFNKLSDIKDIIGEICEEKQNDIYFIISELLAKLKPELVN